MAASVTRLHVTLSGASVNEAVFDLTTSKARTLVNGRGKFEPHDPVHQGQDRVTHAPLVLVTTWPMAALNKVVETALDVVRTRHPTLECVVSLPLGAILAAQ